MTTPPRISEAEWKVMEVIWDASPITAQGVIDALDPHEAWSARTIKTLLGRLLKKGVLTHEVEGKRYLYRPRLSREACVRAEGRTFLERVFGGSTSPLLAHFVKEGRLTAGEIAELRELLREKEGER